MGLMLSVKPQEHGCLVCRPDWTRLVLDGAAFTVNHPRDGMTQFLSAPRLLDVDYRRTFAVEPGAWLLHQHGPPDGSEDYHACPEQHDIAFGSEKSIGQMLQESFNINTYDGPMCLQLVEGPIELTIKLQDRLYRLVPV